ncbi:MAG TPA: DUF3887 domain-containing protein [Anaerolineaceae bacterium]|nr:DUF3887 domain-containing protein [Anaerolineaceae bacterium]
MKRTLIFISLPMFLVIGVTILSACSNSKPITGADRDAVLAYSEPETDRILQAYNENDYASFSKSFDAAMLKGIDEKGFANLESTLMPKIGKYISRTVNSVSYLGNYVQVAYRAKYELDDPVTVRVVFNQDVAHSIAGLWFDSAKLRQK